MTVYHSEDVPEEAREQLASFIVRAYKAGLFCKSLVTRKPGTDKSARRLDPKDRIVYSFSVNEDGDIHIAVEESG